MENQVKVSLWAKSLFDEYNSKNLVNFNPSEGVVLRMTNRQYDNIFDVLLSGKTIRFGKLDLSDKNLTQALEEAENIDAQRKKINIYTSDDYHLQDKKLEVLFKQKNALFLSFGILDYFEESKMVIKSAPLVLLPIQIELSNDKKNFQVKNINHEVCLNLPLIDLLNRTLRIDLAYPVDNNFSLIEYLTYVAAKVRNNSFSVNNGCFISKYNLKQYYMYNDINKHQEQISDLPFVKSISYLNAEFFNFNKNNALRLDNNFLSMLNLDSEEYKIFRRLNLRENILIRTNSNNNKKHLLANMFYNYLLNGKNVLVYYDDDNSHKEILEVLKENKLESFYVDFDKNTLNKIDFLNRLKNKEKLEYDYKLLDNNKINETTDGYYFIKNNYKKLINSLRRANEPLKISLNQAMHEYFSLLEYDNLNVEIPNIEAIDSNRIDEYVKEIASFSKAIEALKCNYQDHPFYGFNNLSLNQEDYLKVRDKIISLSNYFKPSLNAYVGLNKLYNFPLPINLKEMKCLLNIIGMFDNILKIDDSWFDYEAFEEAIKELRLYNSESERLNSLRAKIISLYNDKVFLIELEKLNKDLSEVKFTRKMKKYYQQFFLPNAEIDEEVLKYLKDELIEYYDIEAKLKDIYSRFDIFKEFYIEGNFDIQKIETMIAHINRFKSLCEYLSRHGEAYSYKDALELKNKDLIDLPYNYKKCQIAFNHLYYLLTTLQNYFDKEIIDFANTPLIVIQNKIDEASKKFASINDYLDFYLSWRKLNRTIPNLGDELLKCNQPNKYIYMFYKRLYYQYAVTLINSNPLFKDFNSQSFTLNFKNYEDFNQARIDEIFAFIKNSINAKANDKSIVIHSQEEPFINAILKDGVRALALNQIISALKYSIEVNYPIVLMPINQASENFLYDDIRFDLNIILASEKMKTYDVALGNYHANQSVVFDYQLITNNDDTNLRVDDSERFICSALKTLPQINYISSSYSLNVLSDNKNNIYLKRYLVSKFKEKDYVVTQDVSVPNGVIDILVRLPQSNRVTAIIIDNLNYYSLESAIESFNQSNVILDNLGFISYRLIAVLFFLNEQQEFDKLNDFIVENSNVVTKSKKISKIKPLTEVIFEEYKDPQTIFLSLNYHTNNQPKEEILLDFLKRVSPINKEELKLIIGENFLASLANLEANKKIKTSNGFIFMDDIIRFRCVKKDSNIVRNLDYVSNEEIANGITVLINHKAFEVDYTIKLILSCLGLKKMNHQQYFRIENIIKELIDSNVLINKEGLLEIKPNDD